MNFTNHLELEKYIQEKESGYLLVTYISLPDYEGMVLGIGIIFDIKKNKYQLKLEWISFGLDLFGENLLEDHLYKFDTLEKLTVYLHTQFQIQVTDIPIKYKITPGKFPNPLDDAAQAPAFEIAWQRFQKDFKEGKFLDPSSPKDMPKK